MSQSPEHRKKKIATINGALTAAWITEQEYPGSPMLLSALITYFMKDQSRPCDAKAIMTINVQTEDALALLSEQVYDDLWPPDPGGNGNGNGGEPPP